MLKLVLRTLKTVGRLTKTEVIISRFCSKLNLPYSVEKTAKQIVKKAAELTSGRSPVSLLQQRYIRLHRCLVTRRQRKKLGILLELLKIR